MQRMKKNIGLCMAALFISTPAIAADHPKYVFYMIGDGLGAAQRQFSEFFIREKDHDDSEELLMNTFEVAGLT